MTTTNEELISIPRELPRPVPWDRGQFIEALVIMRGWPIILMPTDDESLPGSPCGLWTAPDDHDLLVREAPTFEVL